MLKKQSVLIANREQAIDIRGIGTRLADPAPSLIAEAFSDSPDSGALDVLVNSSGLDGEHSASEILD